MPASAARTIGLAVRRFAVLLACGLPLSLPAQDAGSGRAAPADSGCARCEEWNEPQRPFRIHGDTYYVGTHGLAAILVTSSRGHVLIDGALPSSAAQIARNVERLGFRMSDVRLILNSHAHFDHAGGIAALQRASRAEVAASPWSARVLRRGESLPDDPQHGVLSRFPAVPTVRVLRDGETVRVGPLALTAHFTGGHTPGGTSWSWRSCQDGRCLDLVYADSQTPVSADGFLYSRSAAYPSGIRDFEHGFAVLERLPCDVLLTPHPTASALWDRLAAREAGDSNALRDPSACRRYAANARQQLARRLADEAAQR